MIWCPLTEVYAVKTFIHRYIDTYSQRIEYGVPNLIQQGLLLRLAGKKNWSDFHGSCSILIKEAHPSLGRVIKALRLRSHLRALEDPFQDWVLRLIRKQSSEYPHFFNQF